MIYETNAQSLYTSMASEKSASSKCEVLGNFFKEKKVLITGNTGFKGSWLSVWLHDKGAELYGYALKPNTEPSMFSSLNIEKLFKRCVYADLKNEELLTEYFKSVKPEIVFHLAAQPLVRLSYAEPKYTYESNVIGTLNVLEAARKCGSVKSFVNVTTDKCYENRETTKGYVEEDPMGGYDMYSSSKGCVEIMSSSYRRSFLQDDNSYAMATARAGNVIGGGDWALDRLIPDCIRSIEAARPIEIRNPSSVRPWQHVLEPLSGYMLIAYLLYTKGKDYAQGFNLGPDEDSVLTVEDVTRLFTKTYGKGEFIYGERSSLHEAGILTLNTDKAKKILGWCPAYKASDAIACTADWYKQFYELLPNVATDKEITISKLCSVKTEMTNRTCKTDASVNTDALLNISRQMLSFTKSQIADYEHKISWKKASG
ncbi:MAG: CDP-glucose 4,6-dehydratase [Succinivibrio sp.]|nr:CDP-glucose 4,6-dehydratase [Succinivibrio sp.]